MRRRIVIEMAAMHSLGLAMSDAVDPAVKKTQPLPSISYTDD